MHTLLKKVSISSIIKVVNIAFLIFLIGFEIVPSSSIKEGQSIVSADFQRIYSQSLERLVYNMQYGPASQKVELLKDLQTTLSAFEHEQTLLWTNSDSGVQNLLNQAQPDYLSIVVATQVLLNHPANPVSLVQFNIILIYNRGFFSTMNALVLLMEQQVQDRSSQLFSIRLILVGINLALMLFGIFFDTYRHSYRRHSKR